MMPKHMIAAALAFLFLQTTPAFAWGSEGHQIIALIAADRLTDTARRQVSDLLGGDARSRMAEVSTWADAIRRTRHETARWHYVNIELSEKGYNPARDCPGQDCVVAQVQKDIRILSDKSLTKAVRAEALRFLIHFVGDLHQPLHCADNHDRGGNALKVVLGHRRTNLHAVWDTAVVHALGHDPQTVADRLEPGITPKRAAAWAKGTPVDWANESFTIAKVQIYKRFNGEGGTEAPIILPDDYSTKKNRIVRRQLEKAAVRLASVLNNAL